MSPTIRKSRYDPRPIEKHTTASWANMDSIEQLSHVHRPSEEEVRNAKAYVEENQK